MSSQAAETTGIHEDHLGGAQRADDLTRPRYGATFGEAIKRCFSNAMNFHGRASRSEFWWAQLFAALVTAVPLACIAIALPMLVVESEPTLEFGAVSDSGMILLTVGILAAPIVMLALLLPYFTLAIRRLNDANLPVALVLLPLLPGVGMIALWAVCALPSRAAGRQRDRLVY